MLLRAVLAVAFVAPAPTPVGPVPTDGAPSGDVAEGAPGSTPDPAPADGPTREAADPGDDEGGADDGPDPASPPRAERGGAFAVRATDRMDPYGARPNGVPHIDLEQITRYALDNPLVLEAEQQVEAMRNQVRKADFAWVPIIETQSMLMPGVRVRCEDVSLDNGTPEGFDFQYCYSGRSADDRDFNINTVGGYFAQLADAGVRFEFQANTIVPLTTFGKIRNTKRAARAALAIKQLEKLQAEQQTILLVQQAHNTLLLARRTIGILREAEKVVDRAARRVEGDVGSGDDWDEDPSGDSERDPDDLFKVRLARVEVEQLMRKALKIESLSLSALWALAGTAAPRGFDISETELSPWEIDGGLQGLADYKDLAITHRPEARMASAAVKAREYQEKLARANFLPDLGIVLRFQYGVSTSADQNITQIYYTNGFNYSRLVAALGLRWRWDFHNAVFDLRTARATRRAAEYKADAARLLLGRDVEQAYADLVESKHIVATAREAVDWSWKLVISGEQRDTIGAGNTQELIRALEKWYRKRFELEEAIQAHNDAVARLSRAVGTALVGPRRRSRQPASAASAP